MTTEATALWVTRPGVAELRREPLKSPGPGEALVQAEYGAISRGTESLVFAGAIPPQMVESMRCPHQAGTLSLPVKYGYCSVGRVVAGDTPLVGKRVFCLHPHQDSYIVPAQSLSEIPSFVPSRRAVLAANQETAVNALWDSRPAVGARVSVVGAGAVGLLIARMLEASVGVELEVVDVNEQRLELCRRLELRGVTPERAEGDRDWVFHSSGNPSGLDTALALAGFEAEVVELSWYGTRPVAVALGGHFHDRRITLRSSQVGSVATSMRPRWSYARRMQLALRLLGDSALDALLSEPVRFEQLPAAMPELFAGVGSTVTQLIEYPLPGGSQSRKAK